LKIASRGPLRFLGLRRAIRERTLPSAVVVIPIGSYNPKYGVTLSLPSILGREGVAQILEPEMSEQERQALQRSAEALRSAGARTEGL